MEVDTGLIIDYETMSKHCDMCNKRQSMVKKGAVTNAEFRDWLQNHKVSECAKNYEGSSGAMEAHSAVVMWTRSTNYNMRYRSVVSDGDSSAFAALKRMNDNTGPYGTDATVQKIECVNHVSKRFGFGVREAKRKYLESQEVP